MKHNAFALGGDAKPTVAVLGAGLSGSIAALELARMGHKVLLVDQCPRPMMGASRHNEGKLHLGYVYAADTRHQTHHILARGSLSFFDTLEKATGVTRARCPVSDPFHYIVPQDSARSTREIQAYFETVDNTVGALCQELGLARLAPSHVLPAATMNQYYADRVEAGFFAPEVAVDPGFVSDIVAAAVCAHPLISFLGAHRVLDIAPSSRTGFRINLDHGGAVTHLDAPGVVNALWEDRVRLDQMVGLSAPKRWSHRWKATVMVEMPDSAVKVPNTTAMVGPYGDFVFYRNGRVYVSWYPTCRLALSTTATPDEIRAIVAEASDEEIRVNALRGLSELMPGAADLEAYRDTTRIGGGFIMAVGARDIDEADSGLHERHQIGVEQQGAWVSVSTGKFCTAPMFGAEAAARVSKALVWA